nr:6797_t:CDS:2 [Entrophospora candida]
MPTQSEYSMPIVPASSNMPTVSTQNFQENIDHVPAESEAPPSRPESPENSENFDPEIEEEGNGAFYHRGAKAFPQSQISESKKVSEVYRYNGRDYLPVHPSRNMIITEIDDYGSMATIKQALVNGEDVPFMPIDIEEYNEYINNIPHYVLRIYGYLVDGQKAVVTISGIKVFFDIRVPDNKNIDVFEIEIKNILANGKDERGVVDMTNLRTEHIKAFPISRYYKEQKPYIRIVTTDIKQRSIALAIILNYNLEIVDEHKLETASDDLRAYYRKVAREYGIPLSGWALLTNYQYNNGRMPYSARSPLCEHAFYVSINNYHSVEDPTELYKTYPSSLITHDRALVLTWDIETYSTLGLDHVPMARYKEDNIFMICMTVHWKDDPKPLKQIYLVDMETVPDPNWITIICGNEKNLLKAFALCWQLLAPDIELTYNNNGSKYDWPFIVERATQWKILDWMLTKMSANSRKKTTIDSILRWNYYGGVGEPFHKDFFHKERTWEVKSEGKKEKDNYNIEDKKIKNREGIEIKITPDKTFTSTFLKIPGCVPIDVIVCCKKLHPDSEINTLNHYLEINGLESKIDLSIKNMRKYYEQSKISTMTETTKYMHKIVEYCIVDAKSSQRLMVEKNMINDYRGVASIAYISLFDSHYYAIGMKVRNLLGAEAWKRNILVTMIMKKTEKESFPGAYVYPPDKGLEDKRPVTGLDFASLYLSLIMTYNLSPEKMVYTLTEANALKKENKVLHTIEFGGTIHAWSIRHENKSNQKGLYPSLLEYLLNKRNEMKHMGPVKSRINSEVDSIITVDIIKGILEDIKDEKKHMDVAKTLNYFIGTPYKNFIEEYDSICFDYSYLDSKQKALKLYMNSFYGETDSLYLKSPNNYYKECDLAYNNGKGTISKLEYQMEMVEITMKVMERLCNEKKYFGIAHKEAVNFKPDELFIKGIDTIKQEVLKEAISNPKQWDFEQFIETAV